MKLNETHEFNVPNHHRTNEGGESVSDRIDRHTDRRVKDGQNMANIRLTTNCIKEVWARHL